MKTMQPTALTFYLSSNNVKPLMGT